MLGVGIVVVPGVVVVVVTSSLRHELIPADGRRSRRAPDPQVRARDGSVYTVVPDQRQPERRPRGGRRSGLCVIPAEGTDELRRVLVVLVVVALVRVVDVGVVLVVVALVRVVHVPRLPVVLVLVALVHVVDVGVVLVVVALVRVVRALGVVVRLVVMSVVLVVVALVRVMHVPRLAVMLVLVALMDVVGSLYHRSLHSVGRVSSVGWYYMWNAAQRMPSPPRRSSTGPRMIVGPQPVQRGAA